MRQNKMAGKHGKSTSKAPLIILIVVAAVIVAAVVAGVYYFTHKDLSDPQAGNTQTTTDAAETSSQTESTLSDSTSAMEEQTTAEASSVEETGATHGESAVDVVVPTEESGDISYFDASFIPNGYVEDTYTGASTTLREVFGNSYVSGIITFNSDGTFIDTLSSSSIDSGAYVVQNDSIIATYINDKNMEIIVTAWDGNVPASFYINYGGYNVYFG